MRMKNLQPLLHMVWIVLLVSACIPSRPEGGKPPETRADLVWPSPPATARIRYVRSIVTPRDLGIRKSFFGRMLDKFTGDGELHFVRPSGVAERAGVVYVADPGAQSLWILDPAENRVTQVQQVGDDTLVSPVAVAVRADGAIFVADSWAGKVILVDRKGKFLAVAAQTGLQRPVGLAYDDRNGRLYVADSAGQRILAYNAQGEKLFSWGTRGAGVGEFNYPTHLAFTAANALLVTDALNFRIQSFDSDGKFLWQFGHHGDTSGSFASSKGVATDSGGHIYVVDALFDAVQLFKKDGTFLLSFGNQGSGPGQFWLPGGLFINDKDRIFVADTYNHRIQVFEFIHTAHVTTSKHQP